MQDSIIKQRIATKYQALAGLMDERMSRQWAAAEAVAYGWGGMRAVSAATGILPHTIRKGAAELAVHAANPGTLIPTRIRRPGGGRKHCTESDSELTTALELLVDPVTRGDPMSPLRWTCKSTIRLAEELTRPGHPVSPSTVGRLLKATRSSLQSNRKTKEGGSHPDRNAQFEHINATVKAFQKRGEPVISVDTKKKGRVGEFKNGGREWPPSGQPEQVFVHDFMDKELGKAIPYGVDDVTGNQGWVGVGIDHDTARFAAEAIHRWWRRMGSKRYRGADRRLISRTGSVDRLGRRPGTGPFAAVGVVPLGWPLRALSARADQARRAALICGEASRRLYSSR